MQDGTQAFTARRHHLRDHEHSPCPRHRLVARRGIQQGKGGRQAPWLFYL